MNEEEALIRAREACAKRSEGFNCQAEAGRYRSGEYDHYPEVICAKAALLAKDEPLPVDRDLADLREVFAAYCEPNSTGAAKSYRSGNDDKELRAALPTFRAIIQRRIDEVRA